MTETPDPFERIIELEDQVVDYQQSLGWANARIADLEVQVSHLEARDQLDRNAQLDQAQDQIAELERFLADARATGTSYRDAYNELKANLTEVTAERNRIRDVAKTAQDQRDQAVKDYAELRHAHAELEDQAEAMRRTIARLRTDIRH